jgi:ribonuclease BN (tRNA processing enzyme)
VGLSMTVLGAAGSYPGLGQACSGYLVQGGGANVVVDLGPGSLANLQRHIGLDEIDAVVLTHGHPDHWTDLAGLRVALKYGLGQEGLRVWGTRECGRLARDLSGGLEPTIVWHDLGPDSLLVAGGLCFTFAPTHHYVETFAVRVDGPGGEMLIYSADTGPAWSPVSLMADSVVFAGAPEADRRLDLLLCESTHLIADEGEGVLHLSARQAGDLGRACGARRLLLTHLWPTHDPDDHRREATEAFGQPVDIAVTNERYHL